MPFWKVIFYILCNLFPYRTNISNSTCLLCAYKKKKYIQTLIYTSLNLPFCNSTVVYILYILFLYSISFSFLFFLGFYCFVGNFVYFIQCSYVRKFYWTVFYMIIGRSKPSTNHFHFFNKYICYGKERCSITPTTSVNDQFFLLKIQFNYRNMQTYLQSNKNKYTDCFHNKPTDSLQEEMLLFLQPCTYSKVSSEDQI